MASSSRGPFNGEWNDILGESLEEFIFDSTDEESDAAYNEPYNEAFNAAFEDLHVETPRPKKKSKKRIHINRDHAVAHKQLWDDYFSEIPKYPPPTFRRRFRMTKPLFCRIVYQISETHTSFQLRYDATGKPCLSGLQKCTIALRILAYGGSADSYDEYHQVGASTAIKCLGEFVEAIITLFGEEYLRTSTPEDTQRLLEIGAARGFPGMIGSIDCMHWEWKNCPTGWRGQYARAHGPPTIVLEAVASQDLWIWHAFFGAPGTLNDLNVLDSSPVFSDLLDGKAPRVEYYVNNNKYDMPYYLTDGIYPKWPTFIQSISLPQTLKDRKFAKEQEAVRKDVERAFGVLQARFAIVKRPNLFMNKVKIGRIMMACIILHNMIVEDERAGYDLVDTRVFLEQDGVRAPEVDLTYHSHMPSELDLSNIRIKQKDKKKHLMLKKDLVEHVWQHFH